MLVSALVEAHPLHERTFPHLDRVHAGDTEMAVSARRRYDCAPRSRRLRGGPRTRMADLGLASGAVYDGLHVRAAQNIEADELRICNERDFRRMTPDDPTQFVVV